MKKLSETANYMMSIDYKERFVAEYWQTKIRYEKLKDFCNRIEVSSWHSLVQEPEHLSPLWILKDQKKVMEEYLGILEQRAIVENIDLNVHGKGTFFDET